MGEQVSANKESGFSKVLNVISGSFAPIIGVLAAAGLLKAALSILSSAGWLSQESGTYIALSAAGNSIFYFLPVFLGVTIAIKLGANGYVGGAIGAALLTPDIVNLVDNGVKSVDFLGMPILLSNYSSTVFPIFIAIFVYAPLEKLLKKVIYKEIQMFMNPLISLTILVPLTLLVFGPFGNMLGEGLGTIISFLSERSGLLAGAVLGGAWTFLTIAGLHWTIIPLAIANLANGPDPIIGMAAPAVFAQIGVALGVFIRTKDKELKSLAISGILPGSLAGTTEAIYYGILLHYRKAFVFVIIGGIIGGAINGQLGVVMNDFVLPSVLSIPAFSPIGLHLIGTGTAFAISIILTLSFGYRSKKGDSPRVQQVEVKSETIMSPLNGKTVALSNVNEPLFATESIGRGTAIQPADGNVYAPADGEVTTLFPTNHAIGVTTENGAEVLIYIGIDTINLQGEHFQSVVKQGDKIKQGDLLLEFDLAAIQEAGYDPITSVVVTNQGAYQTIKTLPNEDASKEKELLQLEV